MSTEGDANLLHLLGTDIVCIHLKIRPRVKKISHQIASQINPNALGLNERNKNTNLKNLRADLIKQK
jgi:hypothetical protein